eukprot:6044959-Heterocapsa_arctica.AAC.1
MSDDNLKFAKEGDVTMICRRIINSLINFEDEMEQHQQLEHLHCLVHSQVLLGHGSSRRPIPVNKGGRSRNRLRRLGDDHDKKSVQKEINNKLRKAHYRIGEATNPGPDLPTNISKQTRL